MSEFDDKLDKILCENLKMNGFDARHLAMTADTILSIKQAVNTFILPPQREIRRVKQSGLTGGGWPLPESSATHYSLGYNRSIEQASENLWGKKK